ncbi:MAG: cytochrome c [Bdellovibrio sp.]
MAASVEEGKRVYRSNCIACHAANPHRAGSVGPALAGSSIELLQRRLIQGRYPEGYTPKQKTGQMPLFPHLRNQIPSLHLFLAQEEAVHSSR